MRGPKVPILFLLQEDSIKKWDSFPSLKLYGLLYCFISVSCVSLNFQLPKDQKAKGVVFQPPPAPYTAILKEGMDSAYENSQTKDIMAFFSNCSASIRFADLADFQKDLLENLKPFQLQTHTETTHQNEKAVKLDLDKQEAPADQKSIRLFLFKKGECFYALSFVTTLKESQAYDDFINFIKEFKAP